MMVVAVAPSRAATGAVTLGTAAAFAVLAGSGISNTGATTVSGDIGSHPNDAQTGFGPGADAVALTGTNHHDDPVTSQAKADLVTAYNDAAGRPRGTAVVGGELGGLVLMPGVYRDDDAPDSLAISGTLTLDGANDPDSVFIFQSGSTLITASGSNVALQNGAQACHIFWQVSSSATLGTGSHLEGSVLAATSITLGNAATVAGRVLASNGAVTLDHNTIQAVPCQPAPTSPPPTSPSPTTPPPTSPSPTTPPPTSPSPTPPPASSPPPSTGPGSSPPGGTPPASTPVGTAPTSPPITTLPSPDMSASPTESTPIPYFPTFAGIVVACAAALGAVLLVLRRRQS